MMASSTSGVVHTQQTAVVARRGRRCQSNNGKGSSRRGHARMMAAAAMDTSVESAIASAREDIRNIAIIAHVDHGKTTLVDAMLAQSKVFRDNQEVQERIMDSGDLERERGITILSKNTSITYGETKINIVDTPGHADFGGEVERVLNMVDGVLLLVDSVEGPMPQTRFVLQKALELGQKVVVVVNKIDRDAAQPDVVVDNTFQLFCDLEATDEQCDFPVVYASGFNGIAGMEADKLADDLTPLFDTILSEVNAPVVDKDAPLQMLVTNIDYDEFKGRICLGRLRSGTMTKGMNVKIMKPGEADKSAKVSELFTYENFGRTAVDSVEAGDIVAVAGLSDANIGETIACKDNGVALPTIEVEEPTVRMSFSVNNSPFAGKEGKFVTTRNIKDRLDKELERNLALRVEPGETADTFIVSGRGALHITILIENLRREGYEFVVGPPSVILKEDENGKKLEPYEEAVIEASEEYISGVVSLLNGRKGQMEAMEPAMVDGNTVVKYSIPTRGMLGMRNSLLTATKGTALINTVFKEYGPFLGDIQVRDQGSLISMAQGPTSSYALQSCQDRGTLFLPSGIDVYEGMVIGIHQRPGDLKLNPCKTKAATNVRSNKDQTVVLKEPQLMGLDDACEFIAEDEQVEVTPLNIRIRKNPEMGKKKK